MRYLPFIVLLLLSACSKNAKAIRRVNGSWKLTEILHNDGQRSYPNEIHRFEQGEKGGDTYATWTHYPSDYSDTLTGAYLINKKATLMVLRKDYLNPVEYDSCTIDDVGKDMLVIRAPIGVLFFCKQ